MAYQSRIRRSVQRHQVNYITDSDSDAEDSTRTFQRTPPSAPQLRTAGSTTLSDRQPSSQGPALSEPAALSSPVLKPVSSKAIQFQSQHVGSQGFDSPQQTQLSGPKSPEWHLSDVENKENALPEQSSTSKQSPSQAVPVGEQAMQRIEALEQDLLQHKQRVRTQLESMQEQLTTLSQHHLNNANLPELVADQIEQDLTEVVLGLHRRLDLLPSTEDWRVVETALASLLDEGAARHGGATQQDRGATLPALMDAAETTVSDDEQALHQAETRLAEDDAAGSAGSSSLDIAIKEEDDEQLAIGLHPEELQIVLQQHQRHIQTQLTAVNEKLETWVCQCFTDLRNRIIILESAAEAAKATPQGTDAATSCCDAELAIAPNADTDSTAAATESSSPKRAYMQLYSAKEMNENVDINACASNSKGSHDAANMGQAQGVGSQHTPLPAIAEVDITTDDSILGIAKAVLHQEFASIPRHKQQMLARLAILGFGGCAVLGSIAIRYGLAQADCFPT